MVSSATSNGLGSRLRAANLARARRFLRVQDHRDDEKNSEPSARFFDLRLLGRGIWPSGSIVSRLSSIVDRRRREFEVVAARIERNPSRCFAADA